jgi:hypothetical protein
MYVKKYKSGTVPKFDHYLSPSKPPTPWVANIFSFSPEVSRILWNPQFHYRVQNSPPLSPIENQMFLTQPLHLTSLISILLLTPHL